MLLKTLIKNFNLQIKGTLNISNRIVKGGYVGDILSDVLNNSKPNNIWITRQVHDIIIAVAYIKKLSGIIIVQGVEPETNTIIKSINKNIPLLSTDYNTFEITGRIFQLINLNQ